MTAALIGAAAFVGFTGTVLPHEASNGTLYSLSEAGEAEIHASLRACRIFDYSSVGATAFQFAVTDMRDAECMRAHLPATARITAKSNWSN
jgi:hypothetical protein